MVLTGCLLLVSGRQSIAQLQVGTGKVDITPPENKLPKPYVGIHDHIYVRAIMITNGNSTAVLINGDQAYFADQFDKKVIDDINRQEGIPKDHIMLTATHAHNAPGPERPVRTADDSTLYRVVGNAILKAVHQAKISLQPAEVGFGEGNVYVNANRDAINRQTRRWEQSENLDFPSDKTLAVIQFRKPSGEPIAVYMNYACHDDLFLTYKISGGFMGMCEQYIEDIYDNKVVVIWSPGAGGDQNALYMRPAREISDMRISNEMNPDITNDSTGAELNAAVFRAMFGDNRRPVLPLDPEIEKQGYAVTTAAGVLMAEEALRVMDGMTFFERKITIEAVTAEVTCPGRTRMDGGREGYPGTYKDGPPVTLSLGTLRIGSIGLGYIDAEVYNKIGQEVKQESPFNNMIFVTMTNGRARSGYIPTDDAFGRYSFQVLGTQLQPGCAERAIVDGISEMSHELLEPR